MNKVLSGLLFTALLVSSQTALSRELSTARSPKKAVQTHLSSSYILGPGDSLYLDVIGAPELSTTFTIGPDGTIYLPRLMSLYVDGLTVDELAYFITQQFRTYLKNPVIYLKPIGYRPVRVYVGGEVIRPGYYTLSGPVSAPDKIMPGPALEEQQKATSYVRQKGKLSLETSYKSYQETLDSTASTYRFTTLYDAIKAAQGITPYSNLSSIEIIRKQPISQGGGKIRTSIDLTKMLVDNDDSVNIRLYDSDVVKVRRMDTQAQDQLVLARKTNLSPNYIEVFVTGRIRDPGPQVLPQGSTLNQALASAGGPKLLRGQVEFLRIDNNGATDRRLINPDSSAKSGEYSNPVLVGGDIIRVRDSIFSATVNVLNEVTGPAVGIYSVYSLFKP